MATVHTYPDPVLLAEAAARHVLEVTRAAAAAHRQASIALSGGSTPRLLYERLAQPDIAEQIEWSNTHIFWGDERAVPPDDPASNYRMARETLLDHVPIPPENVHRISGEIEPPMAAAEYEGVLRSFFGSGPGPKGPQRTCFDLVLLGMGEDGHTASLFPGAEALQEKRRWVVAYYVDSVSAWRITLTPIVLNAAARILFLVSGANKADRLRQVLYGPSQSHRFPAQMIQPTQGRLIWLVDDAAAGRQ